MYSTQFSKNFPLPKNGGHFEFSNFSQKMAKHKIASISLTVWDRGISSKFSTHRVSEPCTLGNFQKFSSSHIWQPFWIFEFLPKMEKHKFALTAQNRVISVKFSTHRVFKKCTLGNLKKIFLFPKMAAILNFQIFAKNRKTEICFYLLNHER